MAVLKHIRSLGAELGKCWASCKRDLVGWEDLCWIMIPRCSKKNTSNHKQVTLLLAIAGLYYRRSKPLHRTPDNKLSKQCSLVTQSYSSTMTKTKAKSLLTCDMFWCIESQLIVNPFTTPTALFKRMRKPVASPKSRKAICHVEAQALTTLDFIACWTWNNDSSTIHVSSTPPQVQP